MAFPDSSLLEKEARKSLALEHITASYTDIFLDHEASYECCSTNPDTGCAFMCRRSPRLLMNGYYILTEDSVLSDEDGNVTLSLSKTSITYKEKLIRIFRRRKRIRRSLGSLFNIHASDSWLNSTACGDLNAHFADASWLETDSEMDAGQNDCNDDVTESRAHEHPPPCSCLLAEEFSHEKSLSCSKYCTVRKDICQMLTLSMGFIISLGARFFTGGWFTTLLSCLLLFLLIYLIRPKTGLLWNTGVCPGVRLHSRGRPMGVPPW
ncbi:transmembrane protein 71 [Eublepharis macularius]|uniref:Transmembrane protein 71 n=1 Tax=Eublepharis macularius TaxID=481883 RepID=A0AA97JQW6_EUBMA|nr:transmembrane protein 71 [Eublepharis macularius]